MVTGPFINAAAVLIGGIAGAGLSHRLPERLRTSMPSVFGLASLGIGVLLIIKCANMPVMVLSVLLGAVIGELCCLENKINTVAGKVKKWLPARGGAQESFIENYVVLIFLFCVSGTGIFGAMHEGMTGDPTVLLTKAFMDFFTAMIFACSLGIAVSVIALPMLIIQLMLAGGGVLLMPFTTPAMMADFTAAGGVLLIATGLRICGIKLFAVINLLPALVLVMPMSLLWSYF